VVTADGCDVITRFPAEDLMIAGREHYYTAHGQLPGIREIDSSANAVEASANGRAQSLEQQPPA